MARASSWNAEIILGSNNYTIYPSEVGEIGEGSEGRIKVADGDRAYQVRDQIFDIGEIEVTILMTDNGLQIGTTAGSVQSATGQSEYNIMQDWCTSGRVEEVVYVIYRDSARVNKLQYTLTNVQCAMGKKNAFNRNGKEVDTHKYVMLPELIEDTTPAGSGRI